ncbi:hypothetical protein XALC_0193 [Xanthomonas albilineans GPE PC73]|uniref:Uncharacterized protein n=2 Tax=Xanthomonas albilineans TaxID=29447 RepID=D2U935_XANAP|nr:hypothetical protein XALC_0193 [Xanthomonas albilineans GPE PC73]
MGLSSLVNTIGAAKTALEIRDFNATGAAISEMTQKVLNLQAELIAVNTAFFEIQQENTALGKQVRELKEKSAQRERYSLFKLSPGVFVQRLNDSPETAGTVNPGLPEPIHFLCPRCFEEGIRSILQQSSGPGRITHDCFRCGSKYPTENDRPPKRTRGIVNPGIS